MGKKILIVSPTPTHPQNSGNRARIFHLSETMRSIGYDPYFFYHAVEGGDINAMQYYWRDKLRIFRVSPVKRAIKRIYPKSIPWTACSAPSFHMAAKTESAVRGFGIDDWYTSGIEKRVLRFHKNAGFQVIWVEYAYLSKILEFFDKSVFKILDTHDIFSERDRLYSDHGLRPEWFFTTTESEKKGLTRADAVVAITKSDQAFFKDIGLKNVVTIGHLIPAAERISPAPAHRTILYIASQNTINVLAWQYFVEKMLDQVMAKIPGVRIIVAGNICSRIPDDERYQKVGYVADIGKLYEKATFTMNPTLMGTGLKIKTVEALAHGCPVVATPAAAGGLEGALNKGVLVGKEPVQFIEHMISLCMDSSRRMQQAQKGLQYAKTYFQQNTNQLKFLLDQKSTVAN